MNMSVRYTRKNSYKIVARIKKLYTINLAGFKNRFWGPKEPKTHNDLIFLEQVFPLIQLKRFIYSAAKPQKPPFLLFLHTQTHTTASWQEMETSKPKSFFQDIKSRELNGFRGTLLLSSTIFRSNYYNNLCI